MRSIGFNFTKILVEKKQGLTKQPEIKTSIDVLGIKELPSDIFKSKEVPLEVQFSYSIKYEPQIAELTFEGNVVLLAEPKQVKEILKDWKKKDFSEEFRLYVFNVILRKANIKAIQMEDELNLPPHFQMPAIRFNKKQDK